MSRKGVESPNPRPSQFTLPNSNSDGDGSGGGYPKFNLNLELVSAHHTRFLPIASFASRTAAVTQSACFQRRKTGCL